MHDVNFEALVKLIVERLNSSAEKLSNEFHQSVKEVGVRYCTVDDLLPIEVVKRIAEVFPDPQSMRLMSSFREKKYTSKDFDKFNPIVTNITFAIQDARVIDVVERITGIKNQVPDPSLYAGGLSAMTQGHFLCPHIDNSHDGSRSLYRTLNLLFYITPGWTLENGGNLELWDRNVRRNATIVSQFNRLAIMETTPTSWHSVSRVRAAQVRKCVSNYYFSAGSPTGSDYFNVTSFSAWPDQPVRRLLAGADNRIRQVLRKIAPSGLGKKDVYRGANQ